LFQGSKRILGPWLSQTEVSSIKKNTKVLSKAECVSGAAADVNSAACAPLASSEQNAPMEVPSAADVDSAVCAPSASSEQNAPMGVPSAAAGGGSCNVMKDGDEKDKEKDKTESDVIQYSTDKNPETQQSNIS
jgi:hypothetical protein